MSGGDAPSIHVWNRCHGCGAFPIAGVRYSCQTCPAGAGNDLCEACYRRFEQGQLKHPPPEAREAPPGRHVFRAAPGVAPTAVQPWLAIARATAPAPAVPDRLVVRPEFRSGRQSFFGSYGFIVAAEDGGQPLLLTALHVLDELAKNKHVDCSPDNAGYTGRELPPLVTSVQLYDPYAANWMLAELGTANAMFVLPRARLVSEEPYSQSDVAAFRVASAGSFQPARLAHAAPGVGEPIWLAAQRGAGVQERTLEAVVVQSSEQALVFRFAPGTTLPPHSSGAPLLNRQGEAVGITIGGGMLERQNFGHACHAASVRRHLGW